MKVSTTVDLSGFRPAEAGKAIAREIGPRTAAATERLKTRLRGDTRGALGSRMANTWRGEVYPVKRPTRTLNPAGLVTSNASKVVSAFDPGALIRARNATYLAIPTENVPRVGRAGKPMTPVEVEARFQPGDGGHSVADRGREPSSSSSRPAAASAASARSRRRRRAGSGGRPSAS